MRERLEYVSVWILLKLLGLVPRGISRRMGVFVARCLFQLRPKLRDAADFNLRLAFPELPEPARRQILQRMVGHLGWMVAEFARFPRYTRENIGETIILDGFDN